jgi:hypothetical protein
MGTVAAQQTHLSPASTRTLYPPRLLWQVYFPLILYLVNAGFASCTPLLVVNAGAQNVALTAWGDEAVVPAGEQVMGQTKAKGEQSPCDSASRFSGAVL